MVEAWEKGGFRLSVLQNNEKESQDIMEVGLEFVENVDPRIAMF